MCCSCSITELKNNVSDSTKRSILAVWAEGVIRPDDGLVSETFQVAVNGSTKRIHWTTEENRRILEATLVPGASIARIARENGVNVNQVFQGRYEYRNGTGWAAKHPRAKLLPVTVVAEPSGAVVLEVASAAAPSHLLHRFISSYLVERWRVSKLALILGLRAVLGSLLR